MQIKANQIHQKINQFPSIWISGDDGYQNIECSDNAIELIQNNGSQYLQVRYYIQTIEELERFKYDYQEVSLFGESKLYIITLQKKLTNTQIKKTLAPLLETPNPKHKLIIVSARLDKAMLKTKWYQALNDQLLEVINWPIKLAEFDQWLNHKCTSLNISLAQDARTYLSQQTQGNLLACKQVLDLAVLLYGSQQISLEQISQLCEQSSQYQVYDLEEALLSKRTSEAIRICSRLSQTESDPTLVIWIVWQNIRIMHYLNQGTAKGADSKEVFNALKVPFFKQKQYNQRYRQFAPNILGKALELISQVDQMAKSNQAGNVWIKLEQIIKLLCKPNRQSTVA